MIVYVKSGDECDEINRRKRGRGMNEIEVDSMNDDHITNDLAMRRNYKANEQSAV